MSCALRPSGKISQNVGVLCASDWTYELWTLNPYRYSQHAKLYCSQQAHSLSPGSYVLADYPCDGGGARRARYILHNIRGVYYDMLCLGPSDRWASLQLMIIALLVGMKVVFPAKTYQILVTSILSQLHRTIPSLYLLACSYVGIPPSTVGLWYLTTQPALDFLSNIVFAVGF